MPSTFDLTLYVDPTKSALTNPIVFSGGNGSTNDEILSFVYSDQLKTCVSFVEGTALSTTYNASGYAVTMSLGTKGGSSPYVTQSNWYLSASYGFTSSFNLSGSAFLASLGTEDYGKYTLQLTMAQTGSNYRKTIMLRDIVVYNPVDL